MHPLKSWPVHFKETILLSVPVIIGQLGNLMMNITDNIMVGNVGYVHLSAASLATSTYMMTAILGIGSMNVIAPLVAETVGAKNHRATGTFLWQSLLAGLVAGLSTGFLTAIAALLLPWMGQPENEVAMAQEFLYILAISNIPMLLFISGKQYCDGLSLTRIGMVITILGVLLNIFLNWLLIFGNWGFPRLELAGSGYATLICRVLMAIGIVLYMLYSKRIAPVRIPYLSDKTLLVKIFRLGIPMGLQIFFEVAAFSGTAIIAGWLSNASEARAAHQIALNISGLSFMIALGISVGASIRIGNALGARDYPNLQRAGNAALILGVICMFVMATTIFLLRHHFPLLYGVEEPEVLRLAAGLLIICAIFQLFDGTQAIAAGTLRGLQDVRFPTLMTFVAYWVIWIPLALLLGFALNLGIYGIWYADVIALAFAAIVLTFRFWKLARKNLLAV
ncbi:MAG: MATE family efflux transporter [Saprospiraceae bacterium]|nr:MATE family efflux transporter [Saprospiraceae bacterium]